MKLEIFKSDRDHWFVKTSNYKEKKQLFKLIKKRDRTAIYFHPDGRKEEQFSISPSESDIINQKWSGPK